MTTHRGRPPDVSAVPLAQMLQLTKAVIESQVPTVFDLVVSLPNVHKHSLKPATADFVMAHYAYNSFVKRTEEELGECPGARSPIGYSYKAECHVFTSLDVLPPLCTVENSLDKSARPIWAICMSQHVPLYSQSENIHGTADHLVQLNLLHQMDISLLRVLIY